jgi:hypothetical protein
VKHVCDNCGQPPAKCGKLFQTHVLPFSKKGSGLHWYCTPCRRKHLNTERKISANNRTEATA